MSERARKLVNLALMGSKSNLANNDNTATNFNCTENYVSTNFVTSANGDSNLINAAIQENVLLEFEPSVAAGENNNVVQYSNINENVMLDLDEFPADIVYVNNQITEAAGKLTENENNYVVDFEKELLNENFDIIIDAASEKTYGRLNNVIPFAEENNIGVMTLPENMNLFTDKGQNVEELIIGDKGKRKKREVTLPENSNKVKKQRGESYVSKTKKIIPKKTLKQDPCAHGKCQFKCTENLGEKRADIFKMFYELDHQGKQNFILSCVKEEKIRRVYTKNKTSRRGRSFKYFLPKNETHVQVCQQFILNTLVISQKFIRYTFDNKTEIHTAKPDQRGKKEPPNKTNLEKINEIDKFIKTLPAVPSHYCRNSSNRLYLPVQFKSLSNVYRLYSSQTAAPVKESVFNAVFRKNYNIGIHCPKKDKCVTCEIFKNTENCLEEENINYQAHLREKDFAKLCFEEDQARAKTDDTFICASFDLQKVLNTPHGDRNMLLYYSRKYSMYNLTVYESGTREGFCYLWGESDGKRGSNEICSVLYDYLNLTDKKQEVKEVNLYCNSCPGQNKNRQVWAMVHKFLKTSVNVVAVKINYLIPGHTYMPVDSMHSCIELNCRNKTIWAPSEWPTIITNSRISPNPYHVEVLSYDFFHDWKEYQCLVLPDFRTKSIEGENIVLRSVRKVCIYKGNDILQVYTTYNPSAVPLKLQILEKRRRHGDYFSPKQAYTNRLPISIQKYKDLNGLCLKGIIPLRYHKEYQKLPKKDTVLDCLDQTDEEDVIQNSYG